MKSFLMAVLVAITSLKFASNEAAFTVIKWNKLLEEFVPIIEGPSEQVEKEERILQSRQSEVHNFNGRPLYITYYEDRGFFHVYENDTKIRGISGEMWTTLSKLLNFTLKITNVKGGSLGITHTNGTYSGILEYARLNKTDVIPQMSVYKTRSAAVEFTPVMWTTSQRIFAYGQWKRNRFWMINLFSAEVWCVFFAFIITLSLVSKVTQRVLKRRTDRNLRSESLFSHLFHTYSTVCNQGNAPDNTGSGSRVLSYTISIFAWLTLTVYSSRLIYSMGQEVFDAPFDNLESLLDKTNFQVLVLNGSVSHITFKSPYALPIFGRVRGANRFKVASTVEDLYRDVCSHSSKYVMFDSEDSVAVRGRVACRLFPVGKAYYQTPVAAGISRRVKYKKTLDIGIMKLREHGLLDAIKKRYISLDDRVTQVRHPENLAIDMDRVYFVFGIFCLGIFASLVTCAVENIIFALKKRENIDLLIQRFPAIKKMIPHCNERPCKMH